MEDEKYTPHSDPKDKTRIIIPKQFEMSSEHDFLTHHLALIKELEALGDRPDKPAKVLHSQRYEEENKKEYFEQAVENVAREILMYEKDLKSVSKEYVRSVILDEYAKILENPLLAQSTRGSAVH